MARPSTAYCALLPNDHPPDYVLLATGRIVPAVAYPLASKRLRAPQPPRDTSRAGGTEPADAGAGAAERARHVRLRPELKSWSPGRIRHALHRMFPLSAPPCRRRPLPSTSWARPC